MSKLVPLLFAGVGSAGISVGGVFLFRSEDSKTEENPEKFLEDLKTFKDQKGDDCSKSLFGDLEFDSISSDAKDFKSDTDGLNSYFGSVPTEPGSDTKGCLIIDWKKTTTSEGKWSGTFTGSWSFVNQNSGFVIFSVAKTGTTEAQLDLIGGAYLLTKEGTSGSETGKIKHKKEIENSNGSANNKKIQSSDFDNNFPKAKTGLDLIKGNSDYGGFVDSSKISNICTQNKCEGSESRLLPTLKFSGKWTSGGDKKIGEWGENLNWFNHIYDGETFSLQTKLQTFAGTGSVFGNS